MQHIVTKTDHDTGIILAKKGTLNREGGLRDQQLRAPCVSCNTGWMKNANDAARPAILRLIKGGPFLMNQIQRRAFAKWAIMLSMTYEFADKETLVTQPAERENMTTGNAPPDNWAVLIGLFLGNQWAEIQNHRAVVMLADDGRIAERPDAQCNVFTLGRTAVVTLGGKIGVGDLLRSFAEEHALYVVWPLVLNDAGAGRVLLDDAHMWRIATHF